MDQVPALANAVVQVATSPLSVAVPRVALPFLKVTVPAGVPLNSGATVAVNITDCPTVEGFSDEISVVVVVA
jgi:hypothetical protein